MRIALLVVAAAIIVSGCSGPSAPTPTPTITALPALGPMPNVVTKFVDCWGWILNEDLRYDYAQNMVGKDFKPERATGGNFPPTSSRDPSASLKILWAQICKTGVVGNETFTNVGYLYACVPSHLLDVNWDAGYKRNYLAIELGVWPPAMASAINKETGLHVTPGEITTEGVNVMHNGVHEWKFKADNWSFVLKSRIGEPTPAVYRYDTQGVTALWTTFDNVSARAHRWSHGGYGNVRYPAEAKFEGKTLATKMFEPGETFWMSSKNGFTGELGGATDTWIPEARFRGNGTIIDGWD